MHVLTPDNAKVEILACTPDAEKLIERCARVCWQSEGKITPNSSGALIRKLIAVGHESQLEHASMTVLFSDISTGLTHEAVRHRICSFSQESTRYVKQDDVGIVVKNNDQRNDLLELINEAPSVKGLGDLYALLLGKGWKKEDARQSLPKGLSTQIAITANMREWRAIFKLRCAKEAHWEIRAAMCRVLDLAKCLWPVLFEDFYEVKEENDRWFGKRSSAHELYNAIDTIYWHMESEAWKTWSAAMGAYRAQPDFALFAKWMKLGKPAEVKERGNT